MAKSKGKSSRKKGGQVEEVVQCPHLHFKTDVIDRNVLSKEQHLNLLSTPKGYRWEEYKKEGGDGGPVDDFSSPARRILCSGRRMKKAEKLYVHNFLAEVWNLLTPEMVDRLKGMLMNEFGMSPQEADDFICKQREENIVNSSTVSFYKKPRDIGDGKYVYDHVVRMRNPNKAHCDKVPKSNIGIRNTWIKDFSDSLSDKMSSYVLDTMCAERTDRQKEIALTLLNRFNTLLEQNASMADPKTPTDKTLVLVADRLATWLDNNVGVSKEAVQQIKIFGEAEKKKKMDEDRKRRHEEMKKERERREAEEEAQILADEEAQKLAGEEAQKLSGEDQNKKLSDQEQAKKSAEEEKLSEGEVKEKSPGGPEEPTTEIIQGETTGKPVEELAVELKQEGEVQKTEEEQPKKESQEAKPDVPEIKEQDEQKEKDSDAAAVAAEQQRALDELKQKDEDEKAAAAGAAVAAAAAAEAEKLKAEEDQKKAAAAEEEKEKEDAAAKAEQQRIEEEQKKAEQETAEAEKQRAEEENKEAAEEQRKAEKEAAELAETEKQRANDEQKKLIDEGEVEPKKASEEPADEKPVAELPEQPLDVPVGASDVPVEDVPPSETTESEPPVSDVEDELVPVSPVKKRDEVESIARVEQKPVQKATPEVAGHLEGLSPEEKEKRTNEVLKSVASIILETKVDTSPRQEALKDIMSKQLEENLGDQDMEAIGKVSSKIGTWIDKMVDQATLEYGEREPSRPPPGQDDIWAPASSRVQPPISVPTGMKVLAEPGWVPGVAGAPSQPGWVPGVTGAPSQPGRVPGVAGAPSQPGWAPGVPVAPNQLGVVPGVPGSPSQPGLVPGVAASPVQPGWVPGTPVHPGWTPGVTGAPTQPGWLPGVSTAPGQPGRVAGFDQTQEQPGWLPGVSGVQHPVSPGTRVPVSQRPKGRIYHLSRTGNGFDVNVISNTRAQEKIRLARGKSPAYSNVPNPNAPMEPSDLKKWYKWTSALGEVAENWAEWIIDTIKGTQQRGEEMVRDKSPQRLSEWREFRDSQAQSARKWQQTKKDMEQRAEMWSSKGRRVQSQ